VCDGEISRNHLRKLLAYFSIKYPGRYRNSATEGTCHRAIAAGKNTIAYYAC